MPPLVKYLLVGLVIVTGLVAIALMNVSYNRKLARMTPQEREDYERERRLDMSIW